MKIDGGKVIVDLDGNAVKLFADKNATVGGIISLILQQYKGEAFNKDNLKVLELARAFHAEKEVIIDKADFAKLKQIVKEESKFTPLVLGQLQEEFMNAEQETGKET